MEDLTCICCEEPCSLHDSWAAGSGSLLRRKCMSCKRIQEAMTHANAKNKKVKGGYNRLSAIAKVAYVRKQKRMREESRVKDKYNFDELEVIETEFQRKSDEERVRIH
jgi:hypothetical protein